MTPKMQTAAETFVLNLMTAAFPNVPVVFANQAIPAGVSLYTKFYIMASDDPIPTGLGISARSRHVGVFQVTIIGPRDVGSGDTGDIADFLRKGFSRKTIAVPTEGTVILKDASVRDMGIKNEEYTQIVRCAYRFDLSMV